MKQSNLNTPGLSLNFLTFFSKIEVFLLLLKTAGLRQVHLWLEWSFDIIINMSQKCMDGRGKDQKLDGGALFIK